VGKKRADDTILELRGVRVAGYAWQVDVTDVHIRVTTWFDAKEKKVVT